MAEHHLTSAEKIEIIRIVGENVVTMREAAKILNKRHSNRPPVTFSTIAKINRIFTQTGNVGTSRARTYNRKALNEDQILQAFNNNPKLSI